MFVSLGVSLVFVFFVMSMIGLLSWDGVGSLWCVLSVSLWLDNGVLFGCVSGVFGWLLCMMNSVCLL